MIHAHYSIIESTCWQKVKKRVFNNKGGLLPLYRKDCKLAIADLFYFVVNL